MDKSIVVGTVALATDVLGKAAIAAVEDYSGAVKVSSKKRGLMQQLLFERGVPSVAARSPAKDRREEVVTLSDGTTATLLQLFDSIKLGVAAGRGKADLELYLAAPEQLSDQRKAARNDLVRIVGSITGKIHKSLLAKEEQEQLNKLQDEEDKLAAEEGREPNLITKASLKPVRPDEVRIGEAIVKIIKIATAAETPDYDATELVKIARSMFVIIGQPDPTLEVK